MKVSKYMTTKLIKATPDMSVKDAFLLMRTHRVRHLPVVHGDKLEGIISDRDLRRPKWVDALDDWTTYYQINDDILVRDVMTVNPEVVYTYDSIRKAVVILRERRYGALPVLDKNGDLVGILSAQDLLAALDEFLMTSSPKTPAKRSRPSSAAHGDGGAAKARAKAEQVQDDPGAAGGGGRAR